MSNRGQTTFNIPHMHLLSTMFLYYFFFIKIMNRLLPTTMFLLAIIALSPSFSDSVFAQTIVPPTITDPRIDGDVSKAHINFENTFDASISLNEILTGTPRANTGITISSLTFTPVPYSSQIEAHLDCNGDIYITTGTTSYSDTDLPISIIIDNPGTSNFATGDTLNLVVSINTSEYPKVTTEPFCQLGTPETPTAVSSIIDGNGGFHELGGAFGITTVQINSSTYALVVSAGDSSVQIIDITDIAVPTVVSSVSDGSVDGNGDTFDQLDDPYDITTVTIGSSTYALVTSNVDDGVQIIDITNLAAPIVASSITDGGVDGNGNTFDELDGARGITTTQIGSSTYALVASNSDDGVQIIDITNPAAPTVASSISDGVGGFDELDGAHGITTTQIGSSTYALATSAIDDGVQIIDITNPAAPTVASSISDGVGGFDELDGAHGITTTQIGSSTYALVASFQDDGVQIINITNPAAPTVASSISDGVGGFDQLRGSFDIATIQIGSSTYALVTSARDDGVQIINITNPASPTVASSITDGGVDGNGNTFDELGGARGITTVQIGSSTYALVASDDDDGVQIIHMGNSQAEPATQEPATQEPATFENPIAVSSVTDGVNGFDTLKQVSHITTVTIDSSTYALVASIADDGIQIIDITNPAAPTAASSIINGTNGFNIIGGSRDITTVTIDSSIYALVASETVDGIQIIDITNPAIPTAVSSIIDDDVDGNGNTFGELTGSIGITTVKIGQSTYALVASYYDNGIQIINITNPTAPTVASSITDGGIDGNGGTFDELYGAIGITTVKIGQSTYALVAASLSNGIPIIDITNPAAPLAVSTVTNDVDGFDKFDEITQITTVKIGQSTYALATSALDDGGVQIIDITNPAAPIIVSSITDGDVDGNGNTFDELSGAYGITTIQIGSSTYALVASIIDDGIQIIDITNPAAPITVSSITDGGVDANGNTFDELDGAYGITTVQIGSSTYALVASIIDDGVQIIQLTTLEQMLTITHVGDGREGLISFTDDMTLDTNTPRFIGTSSDVTFLTLDIDGDLVGNSSVVRSDGTWQRDWKHDPLADGTYTLNVKTQNNVNSGTYTFTIDTNSITDTVDVPVITPVVVITNVDVGGVVPIPFNDGMTIDTNTPRFIGTSNGVTSLGLNINRDIIGISVLILPDGTWYHDWANEPLDDGTYTLHVKTQNNVNSGTYTFTIDTINPINIPNTINVSPTPVVSIANVDVDGVTTPFTDGMTLDTNIPKFFGTSNDATFLTLDIDGDMVGNSSVVRSDGTWQRDWKHDPLADGTYTLTVKTQNNVISGTYTFTIDVPLTPVVSIINVDVDGETVPFTDGMTIDTNTPKFFGTSNDATFLTLDIDRNMVGNSIVVRSDGTWQRDWKHDPLADGTYTLNVKTQNNVTSGTYTIIIDVLPTPVVSIANVDVDGVTTPFTDGMTLDTNIPKFFGTSNDATFLTLDIGGDMVGNSIVVRSDGTWQRDWKHDPLADGTYTLNVKTQNNVTSGTYTFTIDVPLTPVVSIINVDVDGETVPFTDGMTIDTNTPKFFGTSNDATFLTLDIDGDLVGNSSVVRSDGTWQRDWKHDPLADGTYTLNVKTQNNVTSGTYTIIIDVLPTPVISITHVSADGEKQVPFTDGMTIDTNTPKFFGTSNDVTFLTLDIDRNMVGNSIVVSSDGTWQRDWKHSPLDNGTYTLNVKTQNDVTSGTYTFTIAAHKP